ncbi:MAG TPA: MaoC family dehydratase [Nevskiaceae bacterium]|nr:MaoC family dehydratase [Nevskiaceae bacterium]
MSFRYFEDFKTGETIELGSRSVNEREIVDFATQFDPQPFHIDRAAADQSIFKGLIASGWHSCGLLMRLMVDGLLGQSSSMGSPGVDEIQWLLPVRPGDTLSARYKVVDTKASQSKPDRGVVFCECEMTNQKGQVVLRMRSKGMFGRRPAA